MTIHHLAIWTFRLEELKTFYTTYFKGKSNEKYINPQKGFESYFISFNGGATLELMSRTDIQHAPIEENILPFPSTAKKKYSKPRNYSVPKDISLQASPEHRVTDILKV